MPFAIAVAVLVAAVAPPPSTPAPPPQAGVEALEALAWMSGCWMQTRSDGFVEEHWTKPAGGTLLGMGRTVKAGKTSEYEFLQILSVDGRLAYVAKPSGQSENTFPLKSMTDAEVVFEDPKHDFPQRVIYRRNGDGSITARVEGEVGGKVKGMDFPYQRCR